MFILKVVRDCTEIVQILVVWNDPAVSAWIEGRRTGIFYTEGTEFAEVTENLRLGTIDPRTLEPQKERAAGWLPLFLGDGFS